MILYGLLAFLIILILWVIFPRTWSAINRDKPPVGYFIMPPGYIALLTGIEKLVNLNPEIPDDISEIKNIEYKNKDGKSLQIDLYKPDNLMDRAPLLVFIHGGAWKSGKRSDYLVYLVGFAKRGYVTATISYRLIEDRRYPACVEDINDAVDWFFNNGDLYGYDTSRIALIGGSAGAHLALLGAYGWRSPAYGKDSSTITQKSHRIKAVVDIYGPADFTTNYARNHPLIKDFIGKTFEEAPWLYKEASPLTYLDKFDPPTLIFHGTSDRLVPVSQSDELARKLDSLGVRNEYYRIPGWPHTMDIVKRVNDFCQLKMDSFFKKYLD